MSIAAALGWMITSRGNAPAGPNPATVGSGPMPEADFDYYLRSIGIEPQDVTANTEVLVIGETGWHQSTVDQLLAWRAGKTLRVYSQELYVSFLLNGRDPLAAPPDWINAFRNGHAALQDLSQAGFAWPTINVSGSGTGQVAALDAPSEGFLKFLGYHVGSSGRPVNERRQILATAFQSAALPAAQFDPDYIASWGAPSSAARLQKISNSLAAFASLHNPRGRFGAAVKDWESDLRWLHDTYYSGRFTFRWPSTQV